MAWTLLFFMLLSCSTGSFSQSTLMQPPSASEPLKSTAKLTCTLKSGISVGSKNIYWYQQVQGNPPRFLLYYYSDSDKQLGPGVSNRVSGSKDTSKNAASLHISELQADDEAVYYCSIWETNAYVFGSGTKLTVLGQPKSSPSVSVFPPSSEELKANKATTVCMLTGFYPDDVEVAWKADGTIITQGVDTTKPVKQGKKYVASSYLSLTSDQWKSFNSITCKVTHAGDIVEKSVSHRECS